LFSRMRVVRLFDIGVEINESWFAEAERDVSTGNRAATADIYTGQSSTAKEPQRHT
jgi:hypothetical protein